MNQQWTAFAAANPDNWPDQATPSNTVTDNWVAPLPRFDLLSIAGPDTITFLQGQTSADFLQLNSEHALPGCYASPKGRLYCSFLAGLPQNDNVSLRMDAALVESTAAVLAKYMVFSKAERQAEQEQKLVFGIRGADGAGWLQQQLGSAAGGKMHCRQNPQMLAIQLDEQGELFECWVAAEQANAFWQQATAVLTAVHGNHWEAAMIAAGLAEVSEQNREQLLPQMLNYDLTGHINFKKGCYPGQEVIARLHYRGSSKRRLYRASCASDTVTIGDTIYSEAEQKVGEVVRVARLDNNQWQLLAIINVDSASEQVVTLHKNGAVLTLLEHPYAITN